MFRWCGRTIGGMDTTTNQNTTITPADERVRLTRAMHDAAAAGDFDTVLAAFDPGIVWVNDVGAGPWVGRFEGFDAVATMLAEFLGFFEGTFATDVVDLCGSADRSVSVLDERATKDGVGYENRAVWVFRFEGDKVVEEITADLDRDEALAFWAKVADTSESSSS